MNFRQKMEWYSTIDRKYRFLKVKQGKFLNLEKGENFVIFYRQKYFLSGKISDH